MKITREPNEAPDDTHWGVTKQILAVPPEGIDGLTREQAIEAIIKRYGHHEKLSCYDRLRSYFTDDGVYTGDTDRGFKAIKEFVDLKFQTHDDFAHRPLDMQIYGQGKWKKS